MGKVVPLSTRSTAVVCLKDNQSCLERTNALIRSISMVNGIEQGHDLNCDRVDDLTCRLEET